MLSSLRISKAFANGNTRRWAPLRTPQALAPPNSAQTMCYTLLEHS